MIDYINQIIIIKISLHVANTRTRNATRTHPHHKNRKTNSIPIHTPAPNTRVL
jgi:hypothetical protein